MRAASKSPRKVAAVALEVGERCFSKSSHRFSRGDFTLHPLFTLRVPQRFFKTGYRGMVAIVADRRHPDAVHPANPVILSNSPPDPRLAKGDGRG